LAIKTAQNICRRCRRKWEVEYESGPDLSEWCSTGAKRLLENQDVFLFEEIEARVKFLIEVFREAGFKIRLAAVSEFTAQQLQKKFGLPAPLDLPRLRFPFSPSELASRLVRNFRTNTSQYPRRLQAANGFEFWIALPFDDTEIYQLLFAANQVGRVSRIVFLHNIRAVATYGEMLFQDASHRDRYVFTNKSVPYTKHLSRFGFEQGKWIRFNDTEGWRTIKEPHWVRSFGEIADEAVWEECLRNGKPFFSQTPETIQPYCRGCSSQFWSVETDELFSKAFVGRLWLDQLRILEDLVHTLHQRRPPGLLRGHITINSAINWCLDFFFEKLEFPMEIPQQCDNEIDLLIFLLNNTNFRNGSIAHQINEREWLKLRVNQSWKRFERKDPVLYQSHFEELDKMAERWKPQCKTVTRNTVLRLILDIVLKDKEIAFMSWLAKRFEPAPVNPWILAQKESGKQPTIQGRRRS
jgi:hypothetical protein